MTQEEKAKRYDRALERARKCLDEKRDTCFVRPDVIFPELKESEDEYMKNWILDELRLSYKYADGDRDRCEELLKAIAWLEKQGEQKPIDKIEPKFKVGEFVINSYDFIMKVVDIKEESYWYIVIGGNEEKILNCTFRKMEESCHLWDISDAKDGDVLVGSYGIFIFMNKSDGYCGILSDNTFIRSTGNNEWTEGLHPATKEQRDRLFQKIHDAGYEWDAENKELKKFHIIDEGKDEMDYCFTKMMNGEKVSSARSEEDERIRKALIDGFTVMKESKNCGKTFSNHNIPVADILVWLEKQGEQKPIDKIEPKFKNGQWIVFNGLTLYVKEVVKGFYRTITIDGIPNSYDWDIDNIARLWTIADAKDGDVLVYGDNPADHHLRIIMLFKSMRTFNSARNHFHIFDDEFRINDWCDCGKTAHPANKEQRDLLFQEIRKAGYEWDENKKELRKTLKTKACDKFENKNEDNYED